MHQLSVYHLHKNGREYRKGFVIGQTTRSGQTNRGELLSSHNRCPHRLIDVAAGLVPEFRQGGDTLTGDMR